MLRSAGSRAGAPQFALRPEQPSVWTQGGVPLGGAAAAWARGFADARSRSGSASPGTPGSGTVPGSDDADSMTAVVPPEALQACMAGLGPLQNGMAYQLRVRAVDERGQWGEWSHHEAPPAMTVLSGGGGGGGSSPGAEHGSGSASASNGGAQPGSRRTGLVVLCAEGAEPAGTEATARLVQGGAEAGGSVHIAPLWPLAAAAAADGDAVTLRALCQASRTFAWATPSRRAGEPFVPAGPGGALAPTRALLALPAPGHVPQLAALARPSWLTRAFRGLPLGEGGRRSPLHAAAGAGRWWGAVMLVRSMMPGPAISAPS